MVGVWCGIVIGGGIGTGEIENNQYFGWGICEARCIWCGTGGGVFLAGENMNGVGVGTEKTKKRVYGGKCPGGEKSFRSVPKYVGPKTRFWTILVLQDSITA